MNFLSFCCVTTWKWDFMLVRRSSDQWRKQESDREAVRDATSTVLHSGRRTVTSSYSKAVMERYVSWRKSCAKIERLRKEKFVKRGRGKRKWERSCLKEMKTNFETKVQKQKKTVRNIKKEKKKERISAWGRSACRFEAPEMQRVFLNSMLPTPAPCTTAGFISSSYWGQKDQRKFLTCSGSHKLLAKDSL